MQSTRRELLKRMALGAGFVGLNPLLRQLRAANSGEPGQRPLRFVFVSRANGLRPYGLQPVGMQDQRKGNDKLGVRELKEVELHPTMKSLESLKAKTTIVQGLSARMCRGVHSASFGALGANASNTSPLGPTVDHLLSKGSLCAFPHLRLCAAGNMERYVASPSLSAAGADVPLMSYCSPQGAYRDIFGALVGEEKLRTEADLRRNLLDFVADDLRRLNARLTSEERWKLQYYSAGVESLQNRQTRIAALGDKARAQVPEFSDIYASEAPEDTLQAHFDMAAAALITGLTQVVTMSLDGLDTTYRKLGIDVSLHNVGHAETKPERGEGLDMTGVEACHRVRKLHLDLIADMASKLDEVPEGDGTMLDSTAIVFLSEAASTHHAGYNQFPFVIVGGLGGRLKTGRHIHYPNYGAAGNRTIGSFYTTLLHAAGRPQDGFGQYDANLPKDEQQQPLGELLA